MPALNKKLVLELARCEFIDRRENVLALGNSGTGKTHIGLALGLAACQRGYRTRFTTAAALVNELFEARDERRLLRCQKQLAKQDLLIVDELGYVPLSKTGAELLFEVFSQGYEQGSTLANLPFNEWTEVFGSERLTGALLDRLTHHVHILEMNGESFRLMEAGSLFGLTHRPLARFSCEGLHYAWAEGDRRLRSSRRHENRYPFINWSTFAPPKWSKFTPPLTTSTYRTRSD